MAETPMGSARRVLVDVPVNTPSRFLDVSGSPGKYPHAKTMTSAATTYAGQKRGIQEVDEPESPPSQSRMFGSRQNMPRETAIYGDEVRDDSQ